MLSRSDRITEEMYIQGFSTSMPPDVQDMMLRSLPGFENAVISRYAYAIEYDCADPLQLRATLEFRDIDGLCGAGQFNGTSGYEEAAAQGLVAGINAALKLRGEEPLILRRSDGYIGTLIDDLITKGTNEPYRMMTSRSEFRLLLRQDNADERLTPMGRRVGLISDARYDAFLSKKAAISDEIRRLEVTHPKKNVLDAFLAEHGMPESAAARRLPIFCVGRGLTTMILRRWHPMRTGKRSRRRSCARSRQMSSTKGISSASLPRSGAANALRGMFFLPILIIRRSGGCASRRGRSLTKCVR